MLANRICTWPRDHFCRSTRSGVDLAEGVGFELTVRSLGAW
jgi:hypothetical protein